jgi:hypothetical protein
MITDDLNDPYNLTIMSGAIFKLSSATFLATFHERCPERCPAILPGRSLAKSLETWHPGICVMPAASRCVILMRRTTVVTCAISPLGDQVRAILEQHKRDNMYHDRPQIDRPLLPGLHNSPHSQYVRMQPYRPLLPSLHNSPGPRGFAHTEIRGTDTSFDAGKA